MAEKFDFEAALKAVQSGQSITGKDGILRPLVKQLTEADDRGTQHEGVAARHVSMLRLLTSSSPALFSPHQHPTATGLRG